MRSAPICAAGAIAAGILSACASGPVGDTALPPAAGSFPPALVAKGAELAAIGNCATCHTARDGKPLAGGFPVKTPFGTVYGTNLTPDPETGLGRWSEAAFRRALHEGIGRDGEHLYPAFPYDHFTLVTDDDVAALYAYLMTRDPVRSPAPANSVIVPRPFVAVWKSLYFHPGRFRADPARDPKLVRGEYLSEALGHCSGCHTPRNRLGAEMRERAYAGGEVGGWHAPALNAESTSPVRWNAAAMREYLATGITADHAIAAGPMAGVTRNLAHVPPAEVAAIAAYAAALDSRTTRGAAAQVRTDGQDAQASQRGDGHAGTGAGTTVNTSGSPRTDRRAGERIYAGACAGCHERGRASDGGALPLPLAIAPTLPTPANLIHIVRDGIVPRPGERGGWMPPFSGALTDTEVADVVSYVRAMSGYPPWNDVAAAVRSAKEASE